MPQLRTYRLFFKEGLEVDIHAADAVLDQNRQQVRFTGENGKFIDDLIVVMSELQAIVPLDHLAEISTTTNGKEES